MKRWLIRIVVALVLVEVVYLGAINIALNLPATQDIVNRIQPEKFRFRWDRAWSWYPFRLQVTNFNGNFQSWSQQWELSLPEANGTFAVLPLLWGTVNFYNMDGDNLDLKFRPRPRPDRNDANRRQFYPTIEGRDPNLPAEPTPKGPEPGMKLVFEIEHLGGQNTIWIGGVKTTLAGGATLTITQQTRHGPLTLSDVRANLTVADLTVDGQQVADGGTVDGTFNLGPFIPYQNRGLKALAFVSTDVDIKLPIDGLDFLNYYFKPATGMTVGGTGGIDGKLIFDKGDLKPGTDVTISADGLTVAQNPFSVDGSADLALKVADASPDAINAKFSFDSLSVKDQSDNATLIEGKDLALEIDRSSYVLPREDDFGRKRVAFNIPSMTVPDLAEYQRFVPSKWRVDLVGGTGSIDGTAEMTPSSLAINLTLHSEAAKLKFKDDSFETDLSLQLKASGEASATKAKIDISGSSISLDDSKVKSQNVDVIDAWKATLSVSKGEADFDLPEDKEDGRRGFQKLVRDQDLKTLLSTVDGQFTAGLVISDLDWANTLFQNPYSLAFKSSADIDTDLTIRSGYLAEGSKLQMKPQDFALDILDYVAAGNGGFDITVVKGGEEPDLRLEANLTDASFRRQEEKNAVIDTMTLAVTADTQGVTLKDGGTVTAVNLSIPSAKVNDMTAYNGFLPKGSPVRILGGAGDFSAKVDMQENSAGGFLKFNTSRIQTDIDGTKISGNLGIDVKIAGGSAKDRTFDITGSSLSLDNLRAPGTQRGWNARIDLGRSKVVWTKPAKLDASGNIRMTDTRPLIEIFDAHRKENKWLDRILDLKDVRGNATIKVEPNEVVIPYALAKSDTIEIGAKGIFREASREGMFYARYGKLAAILEFDNKKRHFALINATKKFEKYKAGGPLPGMRDNGGSASQKSKQSKPRKGPFSIFKHRR